ncbi:asparagine synthetase A [Myxococcus xanthus]|uniref:asparagine synthetase A n=1 Tax=Myxococcus xanthus TaxID=34 RepID=UPI00112BF634|nr:asparagine synthetase A [Myxococcus xanthus]
MANEKEHPPLKAQRDPPRSKAPRLSPPRSWADPAHHFSEALNNPWYRLICELVGDFCYATYRFYQQQQFVPALLPITSNSISSPMGLGSDSLPVKIELFGKHTYLVDSMQFQLEYMLRHGQHGVFYIMPTFRGEDPDHRHLNQFFHSEAELVGGLEDVIELVGRYVAWCTRSLLQSHGKVLEAQLGSVAHLERMVALNGDIPRVTFKEARKLLGDDPINYSRPLPGICTISPAGEKRLMELFGGIVWLTHLPSQVVPFYQAVMADGEYALCADLLFGLGEVVGCGERHLGYAETMAALRTHQVDPNDYDWYLRMKREYPLRTAGFGLGLERYLAWVLRHDDVRDIHLITRLKGYDSIP